MRRASAGAFVVSIVGAVAVLAGDPPRELAPMRPLPQPSQRARSEGPAKFVNGARGDDANEGAEAKPWKSVTAAVGKLTPGDTLYLRGGVYHECVAVCCSGTEAQPITIRSFPGELAILDGGFREFLESPRASWEPCPGGAPGEFRSTRTYPGLARGDKKDARSAHVTGNFAASMVPLQPYRFHADLQSRNELWTVGEGKKSSADDGVYCGPGLWYDLATQRIHVRLAPTTLPCLGDANYRGSEDPRELALVVAGGERSPLTIAAARYVRIQDLVVRGSFAPTIDVRDTEHLELDHVTAYAGDTCFSARETKHLRVLHCALRGLAAPWTFRGDQKYRGIEAELFVGSKYGAQNEDFEIAWSELTDSHDGVLIGNVKGVSFHHDLLDDVNDDGLFLTANWDETGEPAGGGILVYQNRISRVLSSLAFGIGHGTQGKLGAGIFVTRNVFDLREPVHYQRPQTEEEAKAITSRGRLWGQHSGHSPEGLRWDPLFFYQNTCLLDGAPFHDIFAAGLGGHTTRTTRRLLNDVFVQVNGLPGSKLPPAADDFAADGNLHWSRERGPGFKGDFLATIRKAGQEAHGLFADPGFANAASDVRLAKGSPAIGAGVAIPPEWFDPLRAPAGRKPDAGALPAGSEGWGVGIDGRLPVGSP